MPLMQTPAGEGVYVAPAAHRRKVRLDSHEMRLMRARTFAACQLLGMSQELIAATYTVAESTVSAALKYLRDARAAGRDVLPWDTRPADPDDD